MWKEEKEVGSAERKAATGLSCQGPPGSRPPTEQRGHCSCRPICSPQASVGEETGRGGAEPGSSWEMGGAPRLVAWFGVPEDRQNLGRPGPGLE